jgi:hypothetical protein
VSWKLGDGFLHGAPSLWWNWLTWCCAGGMGMGVMVMVVMVMVMGRWA